MHVIIYTARDTLEQAEDLKEQLQLHGVTVDLIPLRLKRSRDFSYYFTEALNAYGPAAVEPYLRYGITRLPAVIVDGHLVAEGTIPEIEFVPERKERTLFIPPTQPPPITDLIKIEEYTIEPLPREMNLRPNELQEEVKEIKKREEKKRGKQVHQQKKTATVQKKPQTKPVQPTKEEKREVPAENERKDKNMSEEGFTVNVRVEGEDIVKGWRGAVEDLAETR